MITMRYLFLLLIIGGLFACNTDRLQDEVRDEPSAEMNVEPIHRFQGEAMGTYYKVTYIGAVIPELQEQIDSIFVAYNMELSAWEAGSKLNEFNASETGVDLAGTLHWLPNLEIAQRINRETGGAYDPTVAPLMRFWGFGTAEERSSADYDPAEVNVLLQRIGMDRINLEGTFLRKEPGTELDLNASAKGYGVDLVSRLLTQVGRPDHLVDIGGEFRAGGTKNSIK